MLQDKLDWAMCFKILSEQTKYAQLKTQPVQLI